MIWIMQGQRFLVLHKGWISFTYAISVIKNDRKRKRILVNKTITLATQWDVVHIKCHIRWGNLSSARAHGGSKMTFDHATSIHKHLSYLCESDFKAPAWSKMGLEYISAAKDVVQTVIFLWYIYIYDFISFLIHKRTCSARFYTCL